MAGNSPWQDSILEQLESVLADAKTHFDKVDKMFSEEDEFEILYGAGYLSKLPVVLRDEGQSLAARLAALAQQTAPAIRRSPLLTEVDERAAGHAFNRHCPDDLQVCGDHTPVPPSREPYPLCSHPMA